ncbi:PEP-CTERM sorting domain-containing protein [Coraliomargarita algicola]|uniref:PEP-CTERM sorting domain-containing protein n=1 Tax=Coraliomargarita algicola TaxID=3092156 RepID=A0ABZ0RTD1_9BACT|nr:PEP-CTERM sorting domain-containing protein [Coraliomargarita sp. J2-16]WPJ96229.1 PEP-CTERM sorting domain-containing protein [Coraliomargarita sp. J2-16]
MSNRTIKPFIWLAAAGLFSTSAQAATVAAGVNWEAVDLGASGETSQFTVTVEADGNDWLYTWTKTGDLDGLGTSNDTLTFKLRSAAFTGSSYSSETGAVTLGTAFDYSVGDTVTTPTDQHFGPAYDLDNNQSFQLSIEEIVFTQGEDLGWAATFDGFSAISRYIGQDDETFYFGTIGAEVVTTPATESVADIPFSGPVQVLTVTATDNNNRFRDLDFSFTVAVPEPGSYALLAGFTGMALVMLRRRN